MRALCLIIAIVFCYVAGFAQTEQAPTLTLGLNELVGFKKGVIDVELLSEIIANKQDEIKKEIIKREILEPIYDKGNFMYYNYALNVTNLLLKEKNKKVISREVLEYTSNFALVYGFTELYLQLAVHRGRGELKTILGADNIKLLKENFYSHSSILWRLHNKVVNCKDGKAYDKSSEELGKSKFYYFNNVVLDMVFDIVKNDYVVQEKGFALQAHNITEQEYQIKNNYVALLESIKQDSAQRELWIALRRDVKQVLDYLFLYYDVLQETNFLQANSLDNIINYYKNIKKQQVQIFSQEIDRLYKTSKSQDKAANTLNNVDTKLQKNIEKLLQLRNTDTVNTKLELPKFIKDVEEQIKTINDNDLKDKLSRIQSFIKEFNNINPNDTINYNSSSLLNVIMPVLENIQQIVKEKKQDIQGSLKDMTTRINNLVSERAKVSSSDLEIFLQYQVYTIEKNLLDSTYNYAEAEKRVIENLLLTLNNVTNPNKKYVNLLFSNYIQDSLTTKIYQLKLSPNKLNDISKALEYIVVALKVERLSQAEKPLKSLEIENIVYSNYNSINLKKFIEFITRLNELDKAETYDYLFKVLIDAGNVFGDEETARSFNSVVNTVKQYTIIDKEQETLSIDVESIISVWYDKYAERQNSRLRLYFGIGLNQATLLQKSLPLGNENLHSLGFASEKIGIKYTIMDFKRKKNSYKIGVENNGFCSKMGLYLNDWYVFGYGSGLLYNLTNLRTNKNFDYTLIGLGTGVSFFNALDFNLSLVLPMVQDKSGEYPMLNIGFDIKITEYLTELNKKRLRNKAVKDAEKRFSKAN